MSLANLEKFYRFPDERSEIRSQLGKLSDRASFVSKMVQFGTEAGFIFTASELESALVGLDSPSDESHLSDEQLSAVAGGAWRVGNIGGDKTRCLEESYLLNPFCT